MHGSNSMFNEEKKEPPKDDKTTHDTLREAINHAIALVKEKRRQVVMSRIAADRMQKPRSRLAKVLGVWLAAEKFCKKVSPCGKWVLHAHINANDYYQFSVWYDDYTPYAVAMLNYEEGFECLGIDFSSINGYFTSVMGYYYLGSGLVKEEDVDLYDKMYQACGEVYEAQLPADDMYFVAAVWVCLKSKRHFNAYFKKYPNSGWFPKIAAVIEKLGMSIPEHLDKFLKNMKKK